MDSTRPLLSRVYLREEKKSIRVANGLDKPEIPPGIREKWQRLVDLLCRIFDVPASLIMRMTDAEMTVFLSSAGEENPYREGAGDSLGHGLYCETVIGRGKMLEVPDSLELSDWRDNPDVALGMVSYLGFPLRWPDGSNFGTICALDSAKRRYDENFKELMGTFAEVIEADLRRELEMRDLLEDKAALDLSLREIHHRIKNHFFMVAGYVQIKRELSPDSEKELFNDIENRIRAIGLIHENIYSAEDFSPDTQSYVETLAKTVVCDMAGTPIDVDVDVGEVYMGKRLPSLGAVLVELITNSIKYAFGGIESPRIEISLRDAGDAVLFRYADNGCGLSGEVSEGLGTVILRNFATNLGSKPAISGEDGYSVEIAISRSAIKRLQL